jgi:hypothetical protein
MNNLTPLVLTGLLALSGCSLSESIDIANNHYQNLDPNQLISEQGTLVYSDDFDQGMQQWVVETTAVTEVSIIDEALDMDDGNGVTVWFRHPVTTPSVIEFNGTVVVTGGPNDRGTDFNFFWMAQEPGSTDFFAKSTWRGGDMRKYDPMQLYYVGYGANDNSTTRFRRYPGDGTRPLLPQYDVVDEVFMNVPNTHTKIQIVSLDEGTYVYANGKQLYFIDGEKDFKQGYFGFRTWKSHVAIDNFKVYSL